MSMRGFAPKEELEPGFAVRAAQDLQKGDVYLWNGEFHRVVTDAFLSPDERIANVVVAGRGMNWRSTEQYCFHVGTTLEVQR